mmetsp:Transcript_30713/g.98084  ORF Transcript_30713/g.98084 Transcript_30713/m.98084 type:complete len:209 (-) Transcript_30713:357-983(-)
MMASTVVLSSFSSCSLESCGAHVSRPAASSLRSTLSSCAPVRRGTRSPIISGARSPDPARRSLSTAPDRRGKILCAKSSEILGKKVCSAGASIFITTASICCPFSAGSTTSSCPASSLGTAEPTCTPESSGRSAAICSPSRPGSRVSRAASDMPDTAGTIATGGSCFATPRAASAESLGRRRRTTSGGRAPTCGGESRGTSLPRASGS